MPATRKMLLPILLGLLIPLTNLHAVDNPGRGGTPSSAGFPPGGPPWAGPPFEPPGPPPFVPPVSPIRPPCPPHANCRPIAPPVDPCPVPCRSPRPPGQLSWR
jgi:hypothetical protein